MEHPNYQRVCLIIFGGSLRSMRRRTKAPAATIKRWQDLVEWEDMGIFESCRISLHSILERRHFSGFIAIK